MKSKYVAVNEELDEKSRWNNFVNETIVIEVVPVLEYLQSLQFRSEI